MAGKYAAGTEVSSAKSRTDIEHEFERYGAAAFAYGWERGSATIFFEAEGRKFLLRIPLPDPTSEEFTRSRHQHSYRRYELTPEAARGRYEQAVRQRWRAVLLIVKAKLEAVAAGITTVEQEFYAHLLLPNGQTVAEATRERIALAYQSGHVPALLPGPAPRDDS
jgi:hypothetical protein